MKSKRQEKILEIITNNNIETQEDLISALKNEGYNATQATASRDIRQLKLLKVMVDGVETDKLNYTIQDNPLAADFGQITLANDAVINSSVEFHVTVYMSTMFDDGAAQTATAVVKFVK